MTTTVTVRAHNHPTRVFVGTRFGPASEVFLRDDETQTFTVTDSQAVKVFEVSGLLDFGQAVDALKCGHAVARKGWNGKAMFIFLVNGSIAADADGEDSLVHRNGINAYLFDKGDNGTVARLPHLAMRTASGSTLNGWLASQSDILAEDWQIVEAE